MWIRQKRDGKIFYEINQGNTLITSLVDELNDDQYDMFSILIRSLESCFPTMPFFNDLANNPNELEQPGMSEEELLRIFNIFKTDIMDDSIDINSLLQIEPFASNKDNVKKLIKNSGIQ